MRNSVLKNNTCALFLDPLEQFTVYQLFPQQITKPEYHNVSEDHKYYWVEKLLVIKAHVIYFFEIAYFKLNQIVLYNISSPVIILLLWAILGILVVFIIAFDTVRINNKDNYLVGWNTTSFVIKNLYSIVKGIIKSNTALKRKEYFSIMFFLFSFILLSNLFGLVPYTFTITSSFVVTFFLAATHFIAINIIGIFKQGWTFFNLFLPSGVPIFISPFLVIIELISYIAKVFSLSIRLFANMMSGHALLKILIGFSWSMLTSGSVLFYGLAILPWLIVTTIMFLELLIAFLQAYVFVVLIAIYINDVTSEH